MNAKRTSRPSRQLEPNAPQKRIEFVLKQHWKKYPNACIDTTTVASFLVGHDRDAPTALLRSMHAWKEFERSKSEHGALLTQLRESNGGWAMVERLRDQMTGWPPATRRDWSLVPLAIFIVRNFPPHHEYESIIPWVGRELVAITKSKPVRWEERHTRTRPYWVGFLDGDVHDDDTDGSINLQYTRFADTEDDGYWTAFRGVSQICPTAEGVEDLRQLVEEYVLHDLIEELVELLKQKITAIAQWAKETRTDILKVTVAQALDAIATYTFKTSLIQQGTVVYKFSDGWTVQELRESPALRGEGKEMQHCVGSYCDAVAQGNSRIYSLRDPSGNPHVTMEWAPDTEPLLHDARGKHHAWDEYAALGPEELLRSRFVRMGSFEQIYGKQNEKPAEKYVPRVREFIEKMFNGNVKALLMLDIPLEQLDLRGKDLRGMEFRDATTGGLDGYDFTGSDMTDCVFSKNHIERCNFSRCKLVDADFSDCLIVDSNFRDCDASGALFDNARFTGALTTFKGANVDEASFVGVRNAQQLLADANGRAYADHFARRMGVGPVYVDEGQDDPNDEDDAYP